MTFWDHIDDLRKTLVQPLLAVAGLTVVAFIFKDPVFEMILAANSPDFAVYGLAGNIPGAAPNVPQDDVYVRLISTELPSQFMMHMKISFWIGLLAAFPFIVYKLFRFISPGLYENERKYTGAVLAFSCFAFYVGILVNYFIIFPFSLRFLAGYQVNPQVENAITLKSYIGTLLTLSVLMGIFFELPVVSWLLAKLGLINAGLLRKYRRHAIVAILIISAVITPTTDIFTLLLVSVPILLLYELSIAITQAVSRGKNKSGSSVEPVP